MVPIPVIQLQSALTPMEGSPVNAGMDSEEMDSLV